MEKHYHLRHLRRLIRLHRQCLLVNLHDRRRLHLPLHM
jgi:hypothetical protein